MEDESFEITQEHIEAMEAIRNGADVGNRVIAMKLREIERERPELITIGELKGDYAGAGRLPYFGAILTDEGIALLESKRPGIQEKIGANLKQGIKDGLEKARILRRLYDDPDVELHISHGVGSKCGSGWAIIDGVKIGFVWTADLGIIDDSVEVALRDVPEERTRSA